MPEKVAAFESQSIDEEESDVSEGQRLKIIITSNIIGMYTRTKVLLKKKLSGHTDKLTETSNLIEELQERCVKQNEQ